jgi:hypothetical protein
MGVVPIFPIGPAADMKEIIIKCAYSADLGEPENRRVREAVIAKRCLSCTATKTYSSLLIHHSELDLSASVMPKERVGV